MAIFVSIKYIFKKIGIYQNILILVLQICKSSTIVAF